MPVSIVSAHVIHPLRSGQDKTNPPSASSFVISIL
jgi:hypothetical protein